MAKRQPPSEKASERHKIIAAVMEWQTEAAWKIAFGLAVKYRKYKAEADQDRELASKYPDEAIWAKAAERAERAAEIYHQQIVEKHGKLLAIENYLRLNEPDLLPLVPIVDFFGEPPADVLPLVERMRRLESALRVRTTQPGGDQVDANGSAAATPTDARKATPSKRRGRKKADYRTIQKEAAIAEEWARARDAGEYKVAFAKRKGMKREELDALLDRVRKRKSPSE